MASSIAMNISYCCHEISFWNINNLHNITIHKHEIVLFDIYDDKTHSRVDNTQTSNKGRSENTVQF